MSFQTIGAFIFVLGVLIFVHELGHYLVAKYLGIRVDVFSLGFGPRLFGFRRGNTDYRISAIPLGGYVKMAGENPDELLTYSREEFLSRSKPERFAVVIAGPVMNILLAIVFFAVNFMVGVQNVAYRSEPPVIGAIAQDSPAEKSGLQMNDLIRSINGNETPTWYEVEYQIGTSPDLPIELEIERDNSILTREVITESSEDGSGYLGVNPFIPFRVADVSPGSPAERAGLRPGDEVTEVRTSEGRFSGFHQIYEAVNRSGAEELELEVRRAGEVFTLNVAPEMDQGRFRIGASLDFETETQRYGFFSAFQRSIEENYRITKLVFVIVGRLVTGQASIRQMSGPIDIAKYSGRALASGWQTLMGFMALVSLQLGILNLLPIPVLDGGVILLLLIEGLMGRDLSLRAKERLVKAGVIFIVLLMSVVLLNDIVKNLPF